MQYQIPFNKPFISGKELYYISQALLSGKISGDGFFTKKCHRLLEKKFGAAKVLLTHSCTAALEMAALLCNISAGDEVILPSFTFVSTANAFFLRGAKLVFIDIRPDTLNLNENLIESAVTKRTKVIVPVHYGGVSCEMDTIMAIARANGLRVVEDAAQGVCATYKGKFLGTIGDIGAYSFHETKNFSSGEGGAVVINDPAFSDAAEIIREKGTNRSKFYRGEIDKYTWVDIGSSYLPSDILAAFLYAQLENMDAINARRKILHDYYAQELLPLSEEGLVRLPYSPEECRSNHHLFYLILENEETRDALMTFLKSNGILSVFHYVPLHLSPVGRSLGYAEGQLPATETLSGRLLRLPFFYDLTVDDQDKIVEAINMFFKHRPRKGP